MTQFLLQCTLKTASAGTSPRIWLGLGQKDKAGFAVGSALGSVLRFVSAFTDIHKNVPSTDLGMPESLPDGLSHGVLLVGSPQSQVLSGTALQQFRAGRAGREAPGIASVWVIPRYYGEPGFKLIWSQARNPYSPGCSADHMLR